MSPLEALPIELVDNIVTNLDLCDIASLRLTSRTIVDKASELSFTTYFKQKVIKLTPTTLQNFAAVTSQGRLGCLLRNCTLTGIVTNETTTAEEIAEQVRLLADAFLNLKNRSPRGGLVSLTLGLVARVQPGDELVHLYDLHNTIAWRTVLITWRTIFDAGSRSFSVAMAALEESQMSVGESLDVFGSVERFSLPCDVFVHFAHVFSSADVFGSLKNLTLSLSAPYHAMPEPQPPLSPEARSEANALARRAQRRYSREVFIRLMKLWHVTQELEVFDFHWYDLAINTSTSIISDPSTSITSDPPEESSIDTSSGTMQIKNISLRGVYTSEKDLLYLFRTTHPETVTLKDTLLLYGTYTPVFHHLNAKDSSIMSYHLDDLYEGTHSCLVHFSVPGHPKFPYAHGSAGPSTLTRRASDEETIGYQKPPGLHLESTELMRWRMDKLRGFGPPAGRRLFFQNGRAGPWRY